MTRQVLIDDPAWQDARMTGPTNESFVQRFGKVA